jgi:excisionase family DNA binding protein
MSKVGDAGDVGGDLVDRTRQTTDRAARADRADRPDQADRPDEISTGQAADLLGVSRRTVVQLIERGDLQATRVGTRRRLATADVLALLEGSRSQRRATLRDVIAASRDLDLYR